MDLFTPIVPPEKQHPNFARVCIAGRLGERLAAVGYQSVTAGTNPPKALHAKKHKRAKAAQLWFQGHHSAGDDNTAWPAIALCFFQELCTSARPPTWRSWFQHRDLNPPRVRPSFYLAFL